MEAPPENEPLRKYLNRITMQLMYWVPRAERLTIRQELTQHLSAMIEDEVAEGMSREKATLEALRRFGNPRKVGKDIRKKWRQKHPQKLPPVVFTRRQEFWLIAGLGILFAAGVFLPALTDSTRQHDIVSALWHGAVCGVDVLGGLAICFINPCLMPHFKLTAEQTASSGYTGSNSAQEMAGELGTTVSQIKIDRTRRLWKRLYFICLCLGLIFFLILPGSLLWVIWTPALPYHEKTIWCFQIAWFAAMIFASSVNGVLFGSYLRGQRQKLQR